MKRTEVLRMVFVCFHKVGGTTSVGGHCTGTKLVSRFYS